MFNKKNNIGRVFSCLLAGSLASYLFLTSFEKRIGRDLDERLEMEVSLNAEYEDREKNEFYYFDRGVVGEMIMNSNDKKVYKNANKFLRGPLGERIKIINGEKISQSLNSYLVEDDFDVTFGYATSKTNKISKFLCILSSPVERICDNGKVEIARPFRLFERAYSE